MEDRPAWRRIASVHPPRTYFPQQCLYFFPLPQGQGSLRPLPAALSAVGKGRNDPCPCGSGKKYKHCCGK